MQKLVLPLSPNMDKKIIKYGDEFFLGFIRKKEFQNKEFEINNKRQYRFSNFTDLNELKEYIEIIHNLGKKISIVLNHSPNSMNDIELQNEVKWIEKEISPDYYIVKDSFVIEQILKVNSYAKLNISSLNLAFNVDDIVYLAKQYPNNLNRIVFHRDITPSDVDSIIETLSNIGINNLEYEFFVINEWCYNNDGMCSSTHNPESGIPFVCFRELLFDNPMIKEYSMKKSNCYICSIFDIKNINKITHLKIPGRGHGDKTISLYATFIATVLSENNKIIENEELNKKIFGEKYQNMFCKSCIFAKYKKFI